MTEVKRWLLVVGAAVMTVLMTWIGLKLLFASGTMSRGLLFLLGCGAVLGGVFVVTEARGRARAWGAALIAVGFYYFARSSGVISAPWLGRLLGLASIIAAVVLGYIAVTYVNSQDKKNPRE